jgi:hypothetical protein
MWIKRLIWPLEVLVIVSLNPFKTRLSFPVLLTTVVCFVVVALLQHQA